MMGIATMMSPRSSYRDLILIGARTEESRRVSATLLDDVHFSTMHTHTEGKDRMLPVEKAVWRRKAKKD